LKVNDMAWSPTTGSPDSAMDYLLQPRPGRDDKDISGYLNIKHQFYSRDQKLKKQQRRQRRNKTPTVPSSTEKDPPLDYHSEPEKTFANVVSTTLKAFKPRKAMRRLSHKRKSAKRKSQKQHKAKSEPCVEFVDDEEASLPKKKSMESIHKGDETVQLPTAARLIDEITGATEGYQERVLEGLKQQVDLRYKEEENGYTLLHVAAFDRIHGLAFTTSMLDEGRDVNIDAKDHEGRTALYLAAFNGIMPVVKMLVKHDAYLNALDNRGYSPLHRAVRANHLDVAAYLLKRGAEVDIRTAAGWTPLHIAANNGYFDMSKLLLEKGADSAAFTTNEYTPLALALWQGHGQLGKFILEY